MQEHYNSSSLDLEYIFIGMHFDVEFEDGIFTDEEEQYFRDYISKVSQKIFIDKSYVEWSGNKRKDVFMLESGWNALKDLIVDSKYGQYLDAMPNSKPVIIDAFATMGRCYVYELLAKITDKTQSINISVNSNCEFDVIICKDTTNDQKTYLGPWQDWEFDDDGKFLSSNTQK